MFAQPWAWLGLAGLAVPLAIHLLARQQARRAAFPTLRFITASDLNAVRRHRLTDLRLMLIRMAAIAAVVAAVAGPRIRAAALGPSTPAQVLVVDPALGGDAASQAATTSPAIAVTAESLRAGLDAAGAWAATQSRPTSIVVRSYFQRGVLDDAAIARVPAGAGLRFDRVPLPIAEAVNGLRVAATDTTMAWGAEPNPPPPTRAFTIVAGPGQRAAEATVGAVMTVIRPSGSPDASVTLVFSSAPEYARVQSSLAAIDRPWMFDAARPLLLDPDLSAHVAIGSSPRASNGRSSDVLTVLIDADPAGLRAARIVQQLAMGLDRAFPVAAAEPETIADDVLRRWERAPSTAGASAPGEPQGRWLWLTAGALMAVEMWVRRRG